MVILPFTGNAAKDDLPSSLHRSALEVSWLIIGLMPLNFPDPDWCVEVLGETSLALAGSSTTRRMIRLPFAGNVAKVDVFLSVESSVSDVSYSAVFVLRPADSQDSCVWSDWGNSSPCLGALQSFAM